MLLSYCSTIVNRFFVFLAFDCFFSSVCLACFIDLPTFKAPSVNTPPAQYNQLPSPLASPANQSDGRGGRVASCGHNKYWNVGEPSVNIIYAVESLPNEFPWQVAIEITVGASSATAFCGGVIINRLWILTAAHCLIGWEQFFFAVMTFGEHNLYKLDAGEFQLSSTDVVVHPKFDIHTLDYDFALIKVSQPLNFTKWNVQPICLPDSCSNSCKGGDIGYLVGWGSTQGVGYELSPVLRKGKLPILSLFDCALSNLAHTPFSNRMICAGYNTISVYPCNGDSGGGLVVANNGYYQLCGVTSYSYGGCKGTDTYGGFSRVCSVRSWIASTSGT